MFLRIARIVRDEKVPPELIINTDQSQLNFHLGCTETWNDKGEPQVDIVGKDDKKSVTIVPSITLAGKALGPQVVIAGKTWKVCPPEDSPCSDELKGLSINFVQSGNTKHWSTHETMHRLWDEQLKPYVEDMIKKLGLLASQRIIWIIDVWSVHRSAEFREWMKVHYPNVFVIYVPGGCTGLFQPLDVGFQRLHKHAIKRLAHADLIDEAREKLSVTRDPKSVIFETSVKVFKRRSVAWVVKSHKQLDDILVIKKVSLNALIPLNQALTLHDIYRLGRCAEPASSICLLNP